ncbi:hypothetical protein K1719_032955 [Acacia pycnantha]|nr:hypothetical protein K1719_032955 [Acacia pycnantha]
MAFWSPFLLLHLGGPYTISAFALEDNELWLRHLLALLFQLVTAGRVFLSARYRNTLSVPTIMVFVAGTAKYAERIAALSACSINNFRKSLDEAVLPAQNDGNKSPEEHITYLKQVQEAHFFFRKFRGLIVDKIYSSADRRESHQYFASKDDPENSTQNNKDDAEKAYRIIEIELDLMYEFFYTKASLARHPFWSIFYIFALFPLRLPSDSSPLQRRMVSIRGMLLSLICCFMAL